MPARHGGPSHDYHHQGNWPVDGTITVSTGDVNTIVVRTTTNLPWLVLDTCDWSEKELGAALPRQGSFLGSRQVP